MAGLANMLRRAARGGPPPLTTVRSWMGIFSADVQAAKVGTVDELAVLVQAGCYACVGGAHSYNGVQIVRDATAVTLKELGLKGIAYDAATHEVSVEPSVTILELKLFLLDRDRRLISSGNFMAQTVIGALCTGTHGYGREAVMAEGVTALEFLDGQGRRVALRKGQRDFRYAALSFGTIGPIVSLTMKTAPIESFEADTLICRLSQKPGHVTDEHAAMFAVFPYSDRHDPTIALQTIRPARPGQAPHRIASPLFTLRRVSEFIIKRYWVFDKLFPALRRPFQRLISRLDVHYHSRLITDPRDLDYLYDPTPGLESSRQPNVLKSLLSPTHTAYNLAFFVRLADAPEVVRFVMFQADQFRTLGFYLKSMIGVREIATSSDLPFAANFKGPVVAIDLFADVRDYAWLERIQREVFAYFPDVRPHWGKSAIVDEWADTLGANHITALRRLHEKHYPGGTGLRTTSRVRRLLGLSVVPPGTITTAKVSPPVSPSASP